MTLPPDPYAALGVPQDAEIHTIKSAYRKLVFKWHPDKVYDENLKAEAADKFNKIQRAYEILSDEDERSAYDARVRLDQLKKEAQQRYGARSVTQSTSAEGTVKHGTATPLHVYTQPSMSRRYQDPYFEERKPYFSDEDLYKRSSRRTPEYDSTRTRDRAEHNEQRPRGKDKERRNEEERKREEERRAKREIRRDKDRRRDKEPLKREKREKKWEEKRHARREEKGRERQERGEGRGQIFVEEDLYIRSSPGTSRVRQTVKKAASYDFSDGRPPGRPKERTRDTPMRQRSASRERERRDSSNISRRSSFTYTSTSPVATHSPLNNTRPRSASYDGITHSSRLPLWRSGNQSPARTYYDGERTPTSSTLQYDPPNSGPSYVFPVRERKKIYNPEDVTYTSRSYHPGVQSNPSLRSPTIDPAARVASIRASKLHHPPVT